MKKLESILFLEFKEYPITVLFYKITNPQKNKINKNFL